MNNFKNRKKPRITVNLVQKAWERGWVDLGS